MTSELFAGEPLYLALLLPFVCGTGELLFVDAGDPEDDFPGVFVPTF